MASVRLLIVLRVDFVVGYVEFSVEYASSIRCSVM